MTAPDSMLAYYSDRAPYMARDLETHPVAQVHEILAELKARTKDRLVLEIACGTGNWTRAIAAGARSITAVDNSEAMLRVAKILPLANARFLRDDAYELSALDSELYDVGYAMAWVSHIPLARWDEFFTAFHARLIPGATVLLADDIRRSDDGDPYYSKLSTRDSYEIRRLPGGRTYEIVKTYFTSDQLRALLQPYAENLQLCFKPPIWWLTYEVRAPLPRGS